MAEFTITLTAREVLVLDAWLEQVNAQRLGQVDERGQPLAPLTATELLQQSVQSDLANRLRELQQETRTVRALLARLDTTTQETVLATEPDSARKRFLEAELGR